MLLENVCLCLFCPSLGVSVIAVAMRACVCTCESAGSREAVCDAVSPKFSESVPANRRNAVPAARAMASGAR